jgi:hypothetical protein
MSLCPKEVLQSIAPKVHKKKATKTLIKAQMLMMNYGIEIGIIQSVLHVLA